MLRIAVTVVGLGVAVAGAFLYGFLAAEWRLFPYEQVDRLGERARESGLLRELAAPLGALEQEPAAESDAPPGLWRELRPEAGAGLDEEQAAEIARLAALGYMHGYEEASDLSGVTVHLRDRVQPGINLYTSGDDSVALLVDMDGRALHRWERPFRASFPDLEVQRDHTGTGYWRRVHPFENGDLLAIHEGLGLVKVDRDSELLWARAGGYHHDLDVDSDGNVWTLSREPKLLPRVHPEKPVLDEFIEVLDAGGEPVRRISLLEAFERSAFAAMLDFAPPHGDIFHTNTIELLDGRHAARSPIFRRGNLLLSMREMNVIAILDPELDEIVWALAGQWIRQHQPTLVDGGRILIFDNQGHGGMSKVIEIDPFSQAVHWGYYGDRSNGFSSRTGGSSSRLANGNTLITESDSGRAFEVDSQGKVVWMLYNGARAGRNRELVAILCEVIRLPESFGAGWLVRP